MRDIHFAFSPHPTPPGSLSVTWLPGTFLGCITAESKLYSYSKLGGDD
jgi:hypothetical protein